MENIDVMPVTVKLKNYAEWNKIQKIILIHPSVISKETVTLKVCGTYKIWITYLYYKYVKKMKIYYASF